MILKFIKRYKGRRKFQTIIRRKLRDLHYRIPSLIKL